MSLALSLTAVGIVKSPESRRSMPTGSQAQQCGFAEHNTNLTSNKRKHVTSR
jgi:hypothetical protein